MSKFKSELFEQDYNLLVCATDPPSMSVEVIGAGTVDLSGMQPESGYRWVLIAINDARPYAVAGEQSDAVDFFNVQPRDPKDKKLAAILLRAGTVVICGDQNMSFDIADLRMVSKPADDTGEQMFTGDTIKFRVRMPVPLECLTPVEAPEKDKANE